MTANFLNEYQHFVETVTSPESNDINALTNRLQELKLNPYNVNIALLMTGGLGLGSEGGEFQEIVKKILFQGKPLNEDNIFHMKRELGDITWYWINACRALNIDPYEVIEENVRKLKSRYPEFEFSAARSENRREGDL